MELQIAPLSISNAVNPARTASIAHARPVGPAPMQIRPCFFIEFQFAEGTLEMQIGRQAEARYPTVPRKFPAQVLRPPWSPLPRIATRSLPVVTESRAKSKSIRRAKRDSF